MYNVQAYKDYTTLKHQRLEKSNITKTAICTTSKNIILDFN